MKTKKVPEVKIDFYVFTFDGKYNDYTSFQDSFENFRDALSCACSCASDDEDVIIERNVWILNKKGNKYDVVYGDVVWTPRESYYREWYRNVYHKIFRNKKNPEKNKIKKISAS